MRKDMIGWRVLMMVVPSNLHEGHNIVGIRTADSQYIVGNLLSDSTLVDTLLGLGLHCKKSSFNFQYHSIKHTVKTQKISK